MIYIYNAYLLFVIATLPVIMIGLYVYLKDINKEPKKMVAKMFFGGMVAALITVLLSLLYQALLPELDYINNKNMLVLIAHTFIEVALIEEFSKWIIVYLFSYNDKEFDELYDMIVYTVFVSLGFAWIENLLYIFGEGSIQTALVRFFISVPMHASLGILMGYFLSLSKFDSLYKSDKNYKKNLLRSIIVPILLHGIYDFCLYTKDLYILFLLLIFVVFIHIKAYKKIKLLSGVKLSLK